MFDVDTLIADCHSAIADPDPRGAIRDLLTSTVANGSEVADVLAGDEAGINVLFNSPELTVLNVIWAPHMRLLPHDHLMWAAIAIYGGAEHNTLYRRGTEGIQAAGGKLLETGDVFGLGKDAIHSIDNPRASYTGAIHVYGGDFVNQPRSLWDPDTLIEEPYSMAKIQAVFAKANRDWRDQLGTDLDEAAD
jgi:predicted metal-dependent enzyme (double-stranded beta helix superfamily)